MDTDRTPRFTRQMSFVEDEEVAAEIKRRAASRGISPSGYIREAVRQRLSADGGEIPFPDPNAPAAA